MKLWWSKADWTKQNASIAKEFGITPAAVLRARRKLGHPPSPLHGKGNGRRVKGMKEPVDWANVDWTYSDTGVAKSLGCARQTAWQMRKKFAKVLKHV